MCAVGTMGSGERLEAWRVAGGLEAMTTPQHSGYPQLQVPR